MKILKTLSLILLLTTLNTHAFVEERDSSVVTQEEIEISQALYDQGLHIVSSLQNIESNTLEELALLYLAFAEKLGHPEAQNAIDSIILSYPPQIITEVRLKNQNVTERLARVQTVTNSSTVEMEMVVAEFLYNEGYDLFRKSLSKTVNFGRFGEPGGPGRTSSSISLLTNYHHTRFLAGVELLSAAAMLGHPTALNAANSLREGWIDSETTTKESIDR